MNSPYAVNIVFIILTLSACAHKESTTSEANGSLKSETISTTSPNAGAMNLTSWPTEMRAIEEHMIFLLERSSDVKELAVKNAERTEQIKKSFAVLKSKAKNLVEKNIRPDRDPTLGIVAQRFQRNIDLASDSFEAGQLNFARMTLRSAVGQCVQCHTRLEYGPQFPPSKLAATFKSSSPFEKLQLLIATRNFAEAQTMMFETLRKKESDLISPFEWQSFVQLGLVLEVRFRNDFKGTEDFLKLVQANDSVPYFVRRYVPAWLQSVNEWRKIKNQKDKVKMADAFIKKGDRLLQDSRGDAGLIYYLVGARILHEDLAFNRDDAQLSEKLYRLGLLNTWVNEVGSWSMYEDYFELCIRKTPHSAIAKKCYAQLEQGLNESYTGRLNLELPGDIKKRLRSLSTLSF